MEMKSQAESKSHKNVRKRRARIKQQKKNEKNTKNGHQATTSRHFLLFTKFNINHMKISDRIFSTLFVNKISSRALDHFTFLWGTLNTDDL